MPLRNYKDPESLIYMIIDYLTKSVSPQKKCDPLQNILELLVYNLSTNTSN